MPFGLKFLTWILIEGENVLSKVIYKYPIEITDFQFVSIPRDSKILTSQLQDDKLCLWVLCDPDKPLLDRRVFIIGTGNPFNGLAPGISHIDTVQVEGSARHVFAENDEPYLSPGCPAEPKNDSGYGSSWFEDGYLDGWAGNKPDSDNFFYTKGYQRAVKNRNES